FSRRPPLRSCRTRADRGTPPTRASNARRCGSACPDFPLLPRRLGSRRPRSPCGLPRPFLLASLACHPPLVCRDSSTAASRLFRDAARVHGHRGDSPDAVVPALDASMDLDRDVDRLTTYASMLTDEDTRISRHLAMRESAQQLGVQFRSTIAYLRPEILALGDDKVRGFVASEARLRKYGQFLDNILRYAPHTLSQKEEKVAAQAGAMTDAGETVRDVFTNAELPYPEATLSSGTKVRIAQAGYT